MWERTWWGHSGQPVATTFCFPKSLCELPQLFEGPTTVQVLHSHWHSWEWDCGSHSSQHSPTHPNAHPPIPAPLGTALPLPSSPREGKGSFNSFFPSGTLFFFPPPLDPGCGNNVQGAEKVLSIFFPSCRHQKGIVGSIANYITAGFDPLSRGDINLLPLSFSVWVSILSCVLKFLRRKCKRVS